MLVRFLGNKWTVNYKFWHSIYSSNNIYLAGRLLYKQRDRFNRTRTSSQADNTHSTTKSFQLSPLSQPASHGTNERTNQQQQQNNLFPNHRNICKAAHIVCVFLFVVHGQSSGLGCTIRCMYECRFPVEIKQMTCTICKYPATCSTLFWLAANRENLIYIFTLWWVPQTEQNRPRSEFTYTPINCPIYIVVHYPVNNITINYDDANTSVVLYQKDKLKTLICICFPLIPNYGTKKWWIIWNSLIFDWQEKNSKKNGKVKPSPATT